MGEGGLRVVVTRVVQVVTHGGCHQDPHVRESQLLLEEIEQRGTVDSWRFRDKLGRKLAEQEPTQPFDAHYGGIQFIWHTASG